MHLTSDYVGKVTEATERSNFEAMVTVIVCEVAPVSYGDFFARFNHVPDVQMRVHLHIVTEIVVVVVVVVTAVSVTLLSLQVTTAITSISSRSEMT